jgi:hypothetical protein
MNAPQRKEVFLKKAFTTPVSKTNLHQYIGRLIRFPAAFADLSTFWLLTHGWTHGWCKWTHGTSISVNVQLWIRVHVDRWYQNQKYHFSGCGHMVQVDTLCTHEYQCSGCGDVAQVDTWQNHKYPFCGYAHDVVEVNTWYKQKYQCFECRHVVQVDMWYIHKYQCSGCENIVHVGT